MNTHCCIVGLELCDRSENFIGFKFVILLTHSDAGVVLGLGRRLPSHLECLLLQRLLL